MHFPQTKELINYFFGYDGHTFNSIIILKTQGIFCTMK